MFERLKMYQEIHGHCMVTADDPDQELYKWTRSIRKNYKHQFTKSVRPKRKSHNSSHDSNNHNNNNNKNNTTSTATTTTTSSSSSSTTTGQHKTRRPMLSESKVKLLQSVNFCWDVQSVLWEQRYEELAEFYGIHGSSAPLSLLQAEDPSLAIWLQNQRRDYRLYLQDLPSSLTEERLELLEDLGVVEDYQTQQEAWAQHYQYLVDFHQKYGHVNVPQKYHHPVTINVVEEGGQVQQRETTFALGHWCMNQRTARRRWDSLHQEQDDSEAGMKKNKMKKKNSKSKKNDKIASNGSAGDARNIISGFRIRMLDALNFSWSERDTKWHQMLARLKEYHELHGHLKIPTTDIANQDLRNWLIAQRHYYQRQQRPHRSSPMTQARVKAVEESIPDFSWKAYNGKEGPSAEDWSNLFNAMRDKGIAPSARPKQHWFEGANPFSAEVKSEWTEAELMDLWHQAGDDDIEDDGDDDDGENNHFYFDESSNFFVNWEEEDTTKTKQKATTS